MKGEEEEYDEMNKEPCILIALESGNMLKEAKE